MFSELAGFFASETRREETTASDSSERSSTSTSESESSSSSLPCSTPPLVAVLNDDDDDDDNDECLCAGATRPHDLSTYLEPLLERKVEVFTVPLHLANKDHAMMAMEGGGDEVSSGYLEKATIIEDIVPKGSPERKQVEEHLHHFDVQEHTEHIAKTLMNDPIIRAHMSTLVPLHVSYEDFWARYFYRCAGQTKNNSSTSTTALSPSSVIRETMSLLKACENVEVI